VSASRNVVAAFAALTAATATAGAVAGSAGSDGPSAGIKAAPVLPSQAFATKFFNSASDGLGTDQLTVAALSPPYGPTRPYFKVPPYTRNAFAKVLSTVAPPHFKSPGPTYLKVGPPSTQVSLPNIKVPHR
jgi:hypothetical protein